MTTFRFILLFFTLTSLGQKKEENIVEFDNYFKDGIFLNTSIRLFDNNLKRIGNLTIKEIEFVKILAKSRTMYDIDKSSDGCLKSYFIKVKYKNTDYLVFGQDIFEINANQKFKFVNSNHEIFSLFPITNFEMGAADEDGLTGCDDFSILVISNEKTKKYSTIEFPKNEKKYTKSKDAILIHDDSGEEKIYKISVFKDVIQVGIKAHYQEGGCAYNLKINFDKGRYKSKITDRLRFEENEIKQLDRLK